MKSQTVQKKFNFPVQPVSIPVKRFHSKAMHFFETISSQNQVPQPLPENMFEVKFKGQFDLWLKGCMYSDNWFQNYYSNLLGKNVTVYQIGTRKFEVEA